MIFLNAVGKSKRDARIGKAGVIKIRYDLPALCDVFTDRQVLGLGLTLGMEFTLTL